MPNLLTVTSSVTRNAATTALTAVRSVGVMKRAGLIDLGRPLLTAQSSRASSRLGPIAAAVVISALREGSDVAMIDERGPITYADLDGRSNALARALQAKGIAPGDKVGLLARDHRGVVEVMAATGKLGVRLVLLNTGFAKPQLADVAKREGVRLLIADEEFGELLDAVEPDITCVLAWSDGADAGRESIDALIAAGSRDPLPYPAKQGGLVLLTSGTTGTPKGAPRTIGSPLAAAQFLDRVPQRRGDVVHIAAPTFHGTGLSQFIIALALGNTVVVQRRFDAEQTLRAISANDASVVVIVPTMLQRILALDPDVLAACPTPSLRIVMTAGAALTTDLGNRTTAHFGPVVHNLYGCTEVAVATVALPEDWAAAPGTVGKAPVGVTVKLLDHQDGVITTPGVSGRIFVGNGLQFEGYSGGGNRTVVAGLMDTGDTGHWDDGGRLFVDGRSDDMIVSGGENLFPAEIEDLVGAMDGVADVATLPVDDEDFGQRLRMYVVADGSQSLDEDAVKSYVRSNLARFKVPREVLFVEAIPYTPTGKVARKDLAKLEGPNHT